MHPISRPPPTRRTFAATSALFLFLLLPTPLPSAAAQPASPPPSDDFSNLPLAYRIFSPPVAYPVFLIGVAILFFSVLLSSTIASILFIVVRTRPRSAYTQLASTPPGEVVTPFTLLYGDLEEPIIFTGVGLFFLLHIYVCISCFLFPPVLIHPDDSIGRAIRSRRRLSAPRSLDPAVIETFPTVVYSSVKGQKIGEVSLECAVCLNDFLDDDTLRLLPTCDHAFHPDCIGAWLASHDTCPVCRANLASLPAGGSASQLAGSVTEPPQVEVTVEEAPPDGGAPERSPLEGGRERIQPSDLWDKNESGSFNNRNQTRGSDRIQRFPRSHSTGHSLVRPGEDKERFALRLPAGVREQLMDRPGPVLPLEGCSRQGYRCGGEESSRGRYFRRPDRLNRTTKSERWAFDRISPGAAADGG